MHDPQDNFDRAGADSDARKRPLSSWWEIIGGLAAGLGVVATLAAILVPQLTQGHGWRPTQPAAINSQADLATFILSRREWTSQPTVYPSSLRLAFTRQTARHGRGHARAISAGKPEVLTPGDLAVEATQRSGAVIYLMARVVSRSVLPKPRWSGRPIMAVVLAAPRSYRCVRGLLTEPIHAKTGDVVFLRAVVAAVGPTSSRLAMPYVVGLEGFNDPSQAIPSHYFRLRIAEYRNAGSWPKCVKEPTP